MAPLNKFRLLILGAGLLAIATELPSFLDRKREENRIKNARSSCIYDNFTNKIPDSLSRDLFSPNKRVAAEADNHLKSLQNEAAEYCSSKSIWIEYY